MNAKKTILLVDDEQGMLEALEDALISEGHRVLKATTAEEALKTLKEESIDLVTIDIMMPAGASLESQTSSHETGLLLCKIIRQTYPELDVFCLSVVSDTKMIRDIRNLGIYFMKKGEIPLRTVLGRIKSRLTGIAYSTEPDGRGNR